MNLPIRLLALDIDGTLLNSQFCISPADLAALRRVHQLGVEVILCTGRRHTFAMDIARQLGFDLWLCSSNGAVTRSTRGEHFHADLIPASTVRALVQHMDAYRAHAVITFDRETRGALVLEERHNLGGTVSRWIEKNAPYIQYVSPIEKSLTSDPIQAMYCGSLARAADLESALGGFPLRDQVTVLKTEYPLRDLSLLDILNRDCSKGHAVERWAAHRGIPRQEVMAIGDNYNDLEMLRFAGYPVVMGNACQELKGLGFIETLCNDSCGVAAALSQVLGSELMQYHTPEYSP